VDTVIAGVDQVAIDAYGATLFGMKGATWPSWRPPAAEAWEPWTLDKLVIRKIEA